MPTNYPILNLANAGVAVSKDYVDSHAAYTTTTTNPDFQVQHYVLKTLDDEPVGLFVGPVDSKSDCHFTLFAPYNPEAPTQPLNATLLDPQDFNTQIAFDTLPVLEVWHYVTGGIILKFPD